MSKGHRARYMPSYALAFFGGVLITVAILLAVRSHFLLGIAKLSEGTVTSLNSTRGSRTDTIVPVIEFYTPTGSRQNAQATFYLPFGYEVGQKMTVAYNEGSGKAEVLTFGQQFGLSALTAILGMALLFMATILAVGRTWVPKIYLTSAPKSRYP